MPRLWQGKYEMTLEYLMVSNSKEVLKNAWTNHTGMGAILKELPMAKDRIL